MKRTLAGPPRVRLVVSRAAWNVSAPDGCRTARYGNFTGRKIRRHIERAWGGDGAATNGWPRLDNECFGARLVGYELLWQDRLSSRRATQRRCALPVR